MILKGAKLASVLPNKLYLFWYLTYSFLFSSNTSVPNNKSAPSEKSASNSNLTFDSSFEILKEGLYKIVDELFLSSCALMNICDSSNDNSYWKA